MARIARVLWLVTMVAFLSGCTSYRYAVLPQTHGVSDGDSERNVVKPNMNARVTLVTGESISGEVLRVNETELVFGRPGNYGVEEQVVLATEIATIEVEYADSGDKTLIYSGIGVTALAIFVLASFGEGLEEGLGGLN